MAERFCGRLFQGEKVVLERVDGEIEFHEYRRSGRPSLRPWQGRFELPKNQCLAAGGPYRLALASGSVGDILLPRSAVTADRPKTIRFVGCGPLTTSTDR